MDAHATSLGAALPTNTVAAPSPPTERELAILARVLESLQFDGVETLRDQLRMLQVAPTSDAACRIYLVHPDAPRARYSREGRSKLPQGFRVHTPQGRLLGEVNVWVEDGHLRALQYVMHDAQAALALPRPEWVDVPPPPIPASVRVSGAMQSMAGARTVGIPPTREIVLTRDVVPTSDATSPRSMLPLRAMLPIIACVLALATAAFLVGQRGGADLDAARAAGTQAGAVAGAQDGATLGAFDGDTQGRIAGRASTYRPAFVAAKSRGLAAARRAEQQRSDAAAAAFTAQFGYLCPGAVGPSGFWTCA